MRSYHFSTGKYKPKIMKFYDLNCNPPKNDLSPRQGGGSTGQHVVECGEAQKSEVQIHVYGANSFMK